MQPPVVLTVAGSDSGGGAGIQADLATFAGLGVFGATAVTAVTAQSTTGIDDIVVLSCELVIRQIEAVTGDLPVAAAKTGMLGGAPTIAAVGDLAARGLLPNLVVDPVLAASTGMFLAGDPVAAADAYRRYLLPHCAVTTPNASEALALAGLSPGDAPPGSAVPLDMLVEAGRTLHHAGATLVVVTGGDLPVVEDRPGGEQPGGTRPVSGRRQCARADTLAVDVVVGAGGVTVLTGDRIATTNHHGTGCTFSAAVAAGIAQGMPPIQAVQRAKHYVADALRNAQTWRLGTGSGPLDHAVWRPAVVPATARPG